MAAGHSQNAWVAEAGSSRCHEHQEKDGRWDRRIGVAEQREMGLESQMNAIQWFTDKNLTTGSPGKSLNL